MQYSTRQLLLYAAFVAASLASMRVGGMLAIFTFIGIALVVTAFLIVALVARDGRRALAIGFLVPLISDASIHAISDRNELDPFDDFAFPTTQSFQQPYLAFRTVTWTDTATGKVISDYDPSVDPSLHTPASFGNMAMPNSSKVTGLATPDRDTFSLFAHSMIAVTLGMIGSAFANYIYKTNVPQKTPETIA